MKSLIFCFLIVSSWAYAAVTDYQTTFLDCQIKAHPSDSTLIVGIRQFQKDGQSQQLVVEAGSLKTKIFNSTELSCQPMNPDKFNQTYYAQIRTQAVQTSTQLANVGVKRFSRTEAVLTIDMCPSSHPFESRLFDWIDQNHTPVAVSLTAGWGLRHAAEFQRLKDIAARNKNITWINHSYRHPYNRQLPNDKNFLLMAGVNLEHEVLDNEVFMIENGLTPSVFFRFPGLISDSAVVQKISNWGLIITGADAWLAKGQKPQAGGIILVHGNGNESLGVQLFFHYLNQILSLGLAPLS
jgi:hypothetical protein